MKQTTENLTAKHAKSAKKNKNNFAFSALSAVQIQWLLVAILLLAFGLRVHNLEVQSFWNDEGNSARLSERSIPLIIEGTASDIHPPLYYLLLNQYRKLVGDTEFGLRSLSLFAGMLTVPLTFVLGKKQEHRVAQRGHRVSQRKSWLWGLAAAVLLAINPGMVYYSQEARMYALLGFWSVLTTVLLLRWISVSGNQYSVSSSQYSVGGNQSWLWGGAYVLSAAVGLYTHYFFPAVLLAHNIFVLFGFIQDYRHSFTIHNLQFTIHNLPLTIKQWPFLMLAALLLYVPWLPVFLDQFGSDLILRQSFGGFVTAVAQWLTFGATVEVNVLFWWLIALLLVVGVAARRFQLVLPLLGVIVPLGMMWLTGTIGSEFYKFLVVAVPFWLIWLAAGLEPAATAVPLTSQRIGQSLTLVALLVLSWGMVQSLQNMYADPAYARADYRAMANRIMVEDHPNAGVILNAANQWEAFTYYFPDEGNVYPLPEGRSRPNPDEIDATLSNIAAQHDRLYAIFWGEAQRDPERLIERWLDAHAFKATDEWYGDVRFVTYAIPSAPATEMATAVNIPFGDSITLNGYTLGETTLQPGDIVEVTLFWQTAVSLEDRYKVFLHLLDANGNLVSQRDSEPGGGLALTTTWQPGEVVLDNHGLLIPSGLPPGEYQLTLGLYDLADPDSRLPITVSENITDSFSLALVTVGE